jgi:hypothetical protein
MKPFQLDFWFREHEKITRDTFNVLTLAFVFLAKSRLTESAMWEGALS